MRIARKKDRCQSYSASSRVSPVVRSSRERWLTEAPGFLGLERYLVPFNRGVRVFLGPNLARAELFIMLAVLFRKFNFDVSRVSLARVVDLTRNFIIGATAAGSPGILVGFEKASD